MNPGWGADWVCGLLLTLLTVVFHAYNLGIIDRKVSAKMTGTGRIRRLAFGPTFVVGATVLSVTILHGIEGWFWAEAYRFLGALPDTKSAMLYSLNAMTSYGHTNLRLEPQWEMLGALEALNGWILFGLTTAFLYTVIRKIGTHGDLKLTNIVPIDSPQELRQKQKPI